jgi:hypothetical protein
MVIEGGQDPSILDMLHTAGTTLFANGHGHGKAAEAENHVEMIQISNPVLRAILGTSGGWGIILSGLLLIIGQAFESAKEYAQHNLPKTMRPVTNSVISELATLGFVGRCPTRARAVLFLHLHAMCWQSQGCLYEWLWSLRCCKREVLFATTHGNKK